MTATYEGNTYTDDEITERIALLEQLETYNLMKGSREHTLARVRDELRVMREALKQGREQP